MDIRPQSMRTASNRLRIVNGDLRSGVAATGQALLVRERHPVEIHLDLDAASSGETAQGHRHAKQRRRHAVAAPTVLAERAKPRSMVRAQRARRRRAQQLRGLTATLLAVVGVGAAVASTTQLPIPGLDQVVTVDDTAMSPLPDSERRPRPPQAAANLSDTGSTSPSPSPSPSASATKTTTSSASATRTKTSSSTTAKAAAAKKPATRARPGVVLDGRSMGGWYGGASGTGVADGALADWLDQPVTLAAFWADTSDEVQRTVPSLTSEYRNWNHAMDIAVGGTVLGSGENYAAAASGAYDDRWRQAARVIAEHRKGAKGPTFVRPFHEMNGSWYANWTVTKENSGDYKRAFARYAQILRQALPEVYIVFSPNYGDHTGLPIDYWYPGDNVVDVVAPDYYNDYQDNANASVQGWNAEADKRDGNGNPVGPEAWRQFAAKHGKPLGFPEWGVKPSDSGGGDSAAWITAFNAWMNQHANQATWQLGEQIPRAAAGKVLYSAYFNVVHGGNAGFTVYGHGANPNASSAFKGLRWGNNKAAG